MPKPQIAKMLDLSTSHLPEPIGDHDGQDNLNSHDGVTAYRLDYGWLLWVPDNPAEHGADYDEVPAEVLRIQEYARALDCDYVRFDSDGPVNSDLPTWTW